MPTMSEQATTFATRATPDWWEQRVRTEIWYAIHASTYADPDIVWPRLERRLLSLCNIHERKEAA